MTVTTNINLILSILQGFEPASRLSASRLNELAKLVIVEKVSRDINPFRMNVSQISQAMFLLSGDLGLLYKSGDKRILRGGTDAAKFAVDAANGTQQIESAIALTDIEIMRIDLDLLDIMMTWDQIADYQTNQSPANIGNSDIKTSNAEWITNTGIFSITEIQKGLFSRLPSANIDKMFRRLSPVSVIAGQEIIKQGMDGDYYYIIDSGQARVTRAVENQSQPAILAELSAGNAFGEEALVSDNKRNATVTMVTDGLLLRLSKKDFVELLKAPLITQLSLEAATEKVNAGAVWLDVRFASEYKYDALPNAINVPLSELRAKIETLDKTKEYICYCQTGRRSSAAAFILIGHGFNVLVLEGGTRLGRA